MPSRAVFLDRDHTLIEDPGYLSDPQAVQLLPGVELALKGLAAAGFKAVVVTNQAGVARGLVTKETLEKIHGELRRQLSERGAHLDAIYYCPYHPEGTVEGYAIESELRKPSPGMLLKAAEEMDIDLSTSWMVGDSPRDIEAGQRAGCRTVRIRQTVPPVPGEVHQEDVQADFTARNLVEAAKIILRESQVHEQLSPEAVPEPPTALRAPGLLAAAEAAAPGEPAEVHAPAKAARPAVRPRRGDESQTLQEILRYVRHLAHANQEEFSFTKLIAGILQVLAALALVLSFWRMAVDHIEMAKLWALIAVVLQLMALTFFVMKR